MFSARVSMSEDVIMQCSRGRGLCVECCLEICHTSIACIFLPTKSAQCLLVSSNLLHQSEISIAQSLIIHLVMTTETSHDTTFHIWPVAGPWWKARYLTAYATSKKDLQGAVHVVASRSTSKVAVT